MEEQGTIVTDFEYGLHHGMTWEQAIQFAREVEHDSNS